MYHEYQKPDGRIYSKHHNGRSNLATLELDPEDFPNGNYWREAAEAKARELRSKLTDDGWDAWCDRDLASMTWKAIYDAADQALKGMESAI